MNLCLEIKEENIMVKNDEKHVRKVILYDKVWQNVWVIGLSFTLLLRL